MTPLFKKSDPEEKINYRPISLIPSLSKVYEKILYKKLNSFFETKLSPHLYGFCLMYSTQHALSNHLFKCQNCLDKCGVVGTILLNLYKVFDCLPHDWIIARLHAHGLDHDSLRLIKSYLSSRHQRIKLDAVFSSWVQTIIGVPQGSILRLHLFSIFLNVKLLINLRSIVCNFADDNILYYCREATKNVIKNLQSDLKIMLKWFSNDQMMANHEKF